MKVTVKSRVTWGSLKPTTRIVPNKKKYNRKKVKNVKETS